MRASAFAIFFFLKDTELGKMSCKFLNAGLGGSISFFYQKPSPGDRRDRRDRGKKLAEKSMGDRRDRRDRSFFLILSFKPLTSKSLE